MTDGFQKVHTVLSTDSPFLQAASLVSLWSSVFFCVEVIGFQKCLSFLCPGAGTCPGASWDRNSRRKLLGSIKGDSWLHGPSSLQTDVGDNGQGSHILWVLPGLELFPLYSLIVTNHVHAPVLPCLVWKFSPGYKLSTLYSAESVSPESDMHTMGLF